MKNTCSENMRKESSGNDVSEMDRLRICDWGYSHAWKYCYTVQIRPGSDCKTLIVTIYG